MTDQSKIDRNSAKPASLLERADNVFGLNKLGPSKVPGNLPPAKTRPTVALPQEEAGPIRYEPPVETKAETAAPRLPAVELCGPMQRIDRELLRENGLIMPEDPVSALLEEFRIVKRELIADARSSNAAKARSILVSSPHQGDGKTYCTINLAIALAAERDVEVLLVDADVMRPSIARRLGIEAEAGLMDAIADPEVQPESLACRTDIPGLFVLPAGATGSNDSEYLASAQTKAVIERLTRGAPHRYVIFDTPPALAASPAADLAKYVGQAVLVARADVTGRAALDDARQLLSACPDLKMILNATYFSTSGRRFGNYGDRGL